jgi:hypothetical protein
VSYEEKNSAYHIPSKTQPPGSIAEQKAITLISREKTWTMPVEYPTSSSGPTSVASHRAGGSTYHRTHGLQLCQREETNISGKDA